MTTYIARLTSRSDGVVYSAEFDAPNDAATALLIAYELFGAENKIETVYPKNQRLRLEWPEKLAAATAGPEGGE